MGIKTKYIVEEFFTSRDVEKRRTTFEKIIIDIIKKQELHKLA